MARLTSDFSGFKEFTTMPETFYKGHIHSMDRQASKANNPMRTFSWMIDQEGEYSGREIRFDRVVIGGQKDDGTPINLISLFRLIDATQLAWECLKCNNGTAPRDFLRGEGPEEDGGNGLEKVRFHCPDCREQIHCFF